LIDQIESILQSPYYFLKGRQDTRLSPIASPTIFENKQTKVLSIPVSIGTKLTGEAVLL